MHPIVRDNLKKRASKVADKAARMQQQGRSGRKRIPVSGASKRAGSKAYRPGPSVCYDGSWLAVALSLDNN